MTDTGNKRFYFRLSARWVGLAVALLCGCGEAEKVAAPQEATPTAVQALKVDKEVKTEHRAISADVMPWDILPLSFKVGGRIAQLRVEEGDEVKKGQLIAVIDGRDYRLMRELAKTQVEALEPHLARAEKLLNIEAVPPATMDELRSKMEMARIQKSQADAQLSYSRLTAPMDGVIVRRMAAVGNMTDPSHPVAVLANLRPAKVILPVAQRDLPLFKEGQTISLHDKNTGGTWTGEVHSIGFAADEKTRTFPVTVAVSNEDLSLRAGMIVEARLPVAHHEGIFVPLDAVNRSLEGEPSVFLVNDKTSTAVVRNLELGPIVGDEVLVESGLQPGDQVIVRGLVSRGDPITVIGALIASDDTKDTLEPAP